MGMQISNTDKFGLTRIAMAKAGTILFWLVVFYACCYKLWISSVVPFTVPMRYPHDMTWLFKNAISISMGDWLGEYNYYTLIKGPMYSIFLAGLANLGISPKLGIDLTYIFASVCFLLALQTVLHNRFAIILGFLIVLFNPITTSFFWTVPLRGNLNASLVLIYISALIPLIASNFNNSNKIPIYWMMLAGLSLGLAWNTREEAIWMLSGLFPLILICIWKIIKKEFWISSAMSLFVTLLIPIFIWQHLASINEEEYGFNGVTEFKGSEFSRLLPLVYALNTEEDSPHYIYLTDTTISKLNAISNNTRILGNGLGYENGTVKIITARYGSHTSWMIRSAMATAGYYQDSESTEAMYKKIADDIENFCQLEQENCRTSFIPGVVTRQKDFKNIDNKVAVGMHDLVRFSAFKPYLVHDVTFWDEKFKYVVGRYFKINTLYNEEYEVLGRINKLELSRIHKAKNIYKHYKEDFIYFFIAAILIALLHFIFSKNWQPKMVLLLFVGTFTSSFAIYVLLVTFILAGAFPRALISCLAPMLCFTGYFLGLGIETAYNFLQSHVKGLLAKPFTNAG